MLLLPLFQFVLGGKITYRRTLVVAAILLRRVALLGVSAIAIENQPCPSHPLLA